MENQAYSISWTRQAIRQVQAAHIWIARLSLKEANKVLYAIEDTVDRLPANPLRHSLDKYRKSNDGSYRYFTRFRYRITYRIFRNEIRIVQVRHTRRSTQHYKPH